LFTKRYIIDKITSFGKSDLKYSFIDIEVITKELPSYLNPVKPISCISCSNSYTRDIKTFSLDAIDEVSEKQLLNEFIKWLREEKFDILLGWNFIEFDYLYLSARYKYLFGCELSEMLSPIAQSRPMRKANSEESILFPIGLSVCDYLDFYKKIYRT
jgi:DNA polymerase elongation subunit (family B)